MKAKGFRHQALVTSFLILFLLISNASRLPPVYAVNSTPSSTVASKLEELKKEIASKSATIAEQLKSAVDKKIINKVYYGTIEKREKDHIEILDPDSQTKIIKTNQDTLIDKNLKDSEFIVGLGDIDDTKSLVSRKVVRSKKAEDINYLWGKVASVKKQDLKIKNASGEIVSVILPDEQELKINDVLILTGNYHEGVFEADFVYIDKNL